MNEDIKTYHSLAKDAGNRMRAYILSVASGAAGVIFVSLTREPIMAMSCLQRLFMVVALVSFVSTVAVSLIELRVDARRFFSIAKQLERPKEEQDWSINEHYKTLRLRLLNTTYILFAIGLVAVTVYMVAIIMGT